MTPTVYFALRGRKNHRSPAKVSKTNLDTNTPLRNEFDIFSVLLERIRNHQAINTTVLSEALSGPEMSLLVSILNKPENLSIAKTTLQDYIKTIREQQERKDTSPDLRSLADQLKNSGKGYRS